MWKRRIVIEEQAGVEAELDTCRGDEKRRPC